MQQQVFTSKLMTKDELSGFLIKATVCEDVYRRIHSRDTVVDYLVWASLIDEYHHAR